tara:strand:- start:850 stop:1068 length:219 start_codon:yes stop_codon:yes gene_type:complete
MNFEILAMLEEINNSIKNIMTNRWLSIDEVCKYSALSKSTINRAIIRGELRVSKKTGKNLFKKEWVDSFLNG